MRVSSEERLERIDNAMTDDYMCETLCQQHVAPTQ